MDGPWYTIFTGFTETEEIDYEAVGNYLTKLYQQGAKRFYAMAYNSRYSQMTHQEIKELNAFCIRHLKQLNKDNIVIVGDPIHCSTRESLEFTLHAKECGADLISLLVREKHFTDEQILEHYQYIGEKSQFPLLVHEMPFLSGYDGTQMHWPMSLLERLPEVPYIAAIKEDAKDFDITRKVLELEPQIKVIIAGGGKKTFRKYMSHGARAWLNGISIIDAGIAEIFWEACQKDDEEVINFVIQQLEEPFFSGVVKKYGWHRTNKALLQAANLMHRRDRMPLKHLSDSEYAEVVDVYGRISLAWTRFRESYR
nr:dihydrodipicolinate synthase family protein [Bowmanella dokdonensis]